MKKLIYGSLFLSLLSIAIIGCQKEKFIKAVSQDEEKSDDLQKTVSENNINLLNEFNNDSRSSIFTDKKLFNNLDKSDNSNQELFMSYFKRYQVIIDGNVTTIEDCLKQANEDDSKFYNFVLEKMNSLSLQNNKVSDQEIRDAMINECENGYCCFVDTLCVAAVKIAYWFR